MDYKYFLKKLLHHYDSCSPIACNTQTAFNQFFRDRNRLKKYLSPTRLRFYNDICSLLPERGIQYNNKRIADVGCGTGHLLLAIKERYPLTSLVGYDFSEEGLCIAKRIIPSAELNYWDIYQPLLAMFDIVFCIETLEHLLNPHQAIRNLLNIMGTRGVLVITVPDGRLDTWEGHVNFWSPESWQVFVQSNCPNFNIEVGLLKAHAANFAIIKNPLSGDRR